MRAGAECDFAIRLSPGFCATMNIATGMGGDMQTGVVAALIAASVMAGSPAWSACSGGKLRNCVDLDLVPQISQQIVGDERIDAPPKRARPSEWQPPYTGPTVGAAPNIRRGPTVGYRWSLD
jgi:hypothetical protein